MSSSRPGLNEICREAHRAAVAARGLGEEAQTRIGPRLEREVPDKSPDLVVDRGVEGEPLPEPGDPQSDGIPVHHERVAVVREAASHDRDDHRFPLRRELEAEFRPQALVHPEQKHACVVVRPERDAHPGRQRVVTFDAAEQARCAQGLPAVARIDENVGLRTGLDGKRSFGRVPGNGSGVPLQRRREACDLDPLHRLRSACTRGPSRPPAGSAVPPWR